MGGKHASGSPRRRAKLRDSNLIGTATPTSATGAAEGETPARGCRRASVHAGPRAALTTTIAAGVVAVATGSVAYSTALQPLAGTSSAPVHSPTAQAAGPGVEHGGDQGTPPSSARPRSGTARSGTESGRAAPPLAVGPSTGALPVAPAATPSTPFAFTNPLLPGAAPGGVQPQPGTGPGSDGSSAGTDGTAAQPGDGDGDQGSDSGDLADTLPVLIKDAENDPGSDQGSASSADDSTGSSGSSARSSESPTDTSGSDQAPADQAPVDQAPVDQAPVQETPGEQPPAGESGDGSTPGGTATIPGTATTPGTATAPLGPVHRVDPHHRRPVGVADWFALLTFRDPPPNPFATDPQPAQPVAPTTPDHATVKVTATAQRATTPAPSNPGKVEAAVAAPNHSAKPQARPPAPAAKTAPQHFPAATPNTAKPTVVDWFDTGKPDSRPAPDHRTTEYQPGAQRAQQQTDQGKKSGGSTSGPTWSSASWFGGGSSHSGGGSGTHR